jgi:hypothetical protein
MEHERGAFKVKPAGSGDAVKKWPEIQRLRSICVRRGLKYRAGILVKAVCLHKKWIDCRQSIHFFSPIIGRKILSISRHATFSIGNSSA